MVLVYTCALFMAFFTLDEAQPWIDENRAVKLGADIPAATHSPIPGVAPGSLAYAIAAFSESSRGASAVSPLTARGSSDAKLSHRPLPTENYRWKAIDGWNLARFRFLGELSNSTDRY